MANQVQIRRDTNADVMGMTPVVGEILYNTTHKRLHAGDGVTAGGIILPNAADLMGQSFTAATAGGSADALTLTLPVAPAAYAKYQRFTFEAAATNTGPATLAVNGLSAVALRKVVAGALAALEAGDIVSGLIHSVVHNGSYFVLEGGTGGGGSTASGSMGDLIAVADVTGASSIDFTSGIDSTYDVYQLVLNNVMPVTDQSMVALRFRRAGQSTFDTSGYVGCVLFNSSTSPAPSGTSSPTNRILLMDVVKSGARGGICGSLYLSNLSRSSVYKNVSGLLSAATDADARQTNASVSGRLDTLTPIDGMRLFAMSGTLAGNIGGSVRLYGLRKTL